MTTPCTIIIPTKDRPALLLRAVSSALLALPEDGEVLVVDDQSKVQAVDALTGVKDTRLKVVVNTGQGGVSNARNFGVSEAKGATLFFLDDDDEILPHYCAHILEHVLESADRPDYGFAAYELVKDDAQGDGFQPVKIVNTALPDGPVSAKAPFKRRMSGFGMGFWIRKHVIEALGPIDENLVTNEDTEYSCRLMANGARAWFTAKPGVRVHDHSGVGTGALAHLTGRTSSAERAACFARIIDRHSSYLAKDHSARIFLAKRFIKLSVKARDRDAARVFVRRQGGFATRLSLTSYRCLIQTLQSKT